MQEEIITIKNGNVFLPQSNTVWMTQCQIANLFECFISKISSNIRAILKTEVLNRNKVCRMYNFKNGNSVEQYNLEMIAALSFRIESRNSEIFRKWLLNTPKSSFRVEKHTLINVRPNKDRTLN
jgi:hypothetical protein